MRTDNQLKEQAGAIVTNGCKDVWEMQNILIMYFCGFVGHSKGNNENGS